MYIAKAFNLININLNIFFTPISLNSTKLRNLSLVYVRFRFLRKD